MMGHLLLQSAIRVLMTGVVLVRVRFLVGRHLPDRLSIRRQWEESHGLRLQLQPGHLDERREFDLCRLCVCLSSSEVLDNKVLMLITSLQIYRRGILLELP